MSTSSRFVITGASGNIGGGVADRLLAAGAQVRVVGRERARLERFVRRGAELAVGDLTDPVFAAQAFAGADALFAMIPPRMDASDYRAFQNRVGAAIATGIRDAHVPRVLNLSSLGAHRATGVGPVNGLNDQERRLDALPDVERLHLRPTYFMENHLGAIGAIAAMGVFGAPAPGDVAIPMIATTDIAEVAARRLLALDIHGSEVLELHGPRDYTLEETARILGVSIGLPDLPYVRFGDEDARTAMVTAGISADVAGLLIEMYRTLDRDRGFRGTQPRSAATTTSTTLERFAETVFAPAYQAQAAAQTRS